VCLGVSKDRLGVVAIFAIYIIRNFKVGFSTS
jgi:hypothetical protein